MNAIQNHIRKNNNTRRTTADKTAQAIRRVCPLASKTKDRHRDTEGQTEICSRVNATNAFLKCTFMPKQEEMMIEENHQEIRKTERDFYNALSTFSQNYNLKPMQTKDFGFPYNLALAIWDIERKVIGTNEDWNSFKLIKNHKSIHFAKEEQCDTGASLYYIPIIPLFKMLRDKSCKMNGQLLLSVCSYLYQIVNVPYYRKQDSYLYWRYEMHEDRIEQGDEDEEDREEFRRQFKIAKSIGDKIQQKLASPKNLEFFEKRLNRFKSKTDFDFKCFKLASEAFSLFNTYPKTTIFRNQPASKNPYDDDYSNQSIGMEMYISFLADTKGGLYQNIEESINAEFNEYGSIEEPTIYRPIDGTTMNKADFDFEKRLFSLLENLYCLLTI